MKTDRQLGSRTQHSGKPTLCLPRAQRRPSAPRPSLPAAFLIANPELKFNSTYRKHSPLEISNRKFLRVFGSHSTLDSRMPVTHHSSLVTSFLIYGSAIKTPANPQGFNDVRFSNRRQNRGKPLACGLSFRPRFLVWQPCVVGAGSSSNRRNHFKLHSERKDFAWLPQ
jgi:hypothetical protein